MICTCGHDDTDHISDIARCTVPGCPCLEFEADVVDEETETALRRFPDLYAAETEE